MKMPSPWINFKMGNPMNAAAEDFLKKAYQPSALEPHPHRLFRLERERHPGQIVSSAPLSLGANTPKPDPVPGQNGQNRFAFKAQI